MSVPPENRCLGVVTDELRQMFAEVGEDLWSKALPLAFDPSPASTSYSSSAEKHLLPRILPGNVFKAGPSVLSKTLSIALGPGVQVDLSSLESLAAMGWLEARRPQLWSSILCNPGVSFRFVGHPGLLWALAPAAVFNRLKTFKCRRDQALEDEIAAIAREADRPWPPTGSEGRHAITSAILTLLRHQPLRPETAARFPRLSLILRAAKRRSDVRISRIGAPEVLTFLMADAGRFFLTNITAGFLHMYGRALKLEEFDVGHACDSLRKLGDKMRFDLHLAPLRLEMISQTPEGASSVLDLDAIREAAISLTYSNDEFRTMHLVACMTRLESLCLTVHERIRPSSGLLDIAPLAALPSLRHLSFDARKVVLVDWTSTIGALAGLTALTFLSFQYGLTLKAVAQPADDANAVPLSIPPPPPPPHPLSLLALLGAELKALDLGAGPPDYDEASSMAARSDPFSFLEHLQGLTALTILRSANCLSSLQRSLPSLRRLSTIIAPGFSIVPLIFPALRELSLTDAENTITSPDDPPPLLDLSTMPALRAVELTHQPRAHRQALPAGYGGRILLGPGTKKLAVVIPIARPAAMEGVAAIAQMEEPSEVLARFHPLPPNLRAFSLSICGPPRSFGEPPLTLNTRPDLAAIFAMIGEASRGYSPRPNLRELSLRMPLPVFAEAGDRADNVLEPAGPRGEVLGPLTRWIPRFPYLRSLRLEPSPELRTRNVDGKDAEQGGAFGTAPNQLGRMLREVVWRDVPQLTVEVVDS